MKYNLDKSINIFGQVLDSTHSILIENLKIVSSSDYDIYNFYWMDATVT